MTTPARTTHPTLDRFARVLLVMQTAVISGVTILAFGLAAAARHDDLAAQHAGESTDGLGVGLGLFFGTVFGLLAIVLITGCIGFFRDRTWGRVIVAITEALVLLVSLPASPLLGRAVSIGWFVIAGSAAVVLASIVKTGRRTPTGATA